MRRYDISLIDLPRGINPAARLSWTQKLRDPLNKAAGSIKRSAALVGVAFKRGVSDTRESPALDVIHLLRQKGADVRYHDPHIPAVQRERRTLSSVADLVAALGGSDCTVIVTDRAQYDWALVRRHARSVVDNRYAPAQSNDDADSHTDVPPPRPGVMGAPQ